MGEQTTFVQNANLVVCRELDNGTDMTEFWQLENNWLVGEPLEDVVVRCYIGTSVEDRETRADGTPKQPRVHDTCSFEDIPESVKNTFIDSITEMKVQSYELAEKMEDDE